MDLFGFAVGGSLILGAVILSAGNPHGVQCRMDLGLTRVHSSRTFRLLLVGSEVAAMNGLISKVKNFIGRTSTEVNPGDEQPPKNMSEVIERLPEAYLDYLDGEKPYRRAAAIVFIAIVLGMGTPLWYQTTRTYRAPFNMFSEEQTISLDIQVHVVVTNDSIVEEINMLTETMLEKFTGNEISAPLNISWSIHNEGLRSLQSLESYKSSKTDQLEVYIAIVSPEEWSYFSATNIYLDRGRWALAQYTRDRKKMEERLRSLVWETMVDVPHLNSIVKRDLREKMQPWQIAALSPSHQKRLIWDSATLSMNYVVQVVYVHDNASPSTFLSDDIMRAMEVFARRVKHVTHLQISSEHLWDFEISNFFDLDVQGRLTLSQEGTDRLLKDVDSQLQTVESSFPVLKILVIEKNEPVVMLDSTGEDSHGAAVASWGAIIPRITCGETPEESQPAARTLAALRVLLGIDSELPSSWKRAPVPLADWEVERLRLRAIVDNAMRAKSAVSALKALSDKITNVVIGDDVAAKASDAVRLVEEGLMDTKAPQLDKIAAGRALADEALSHPSLLAMLYFPKDQTMAVYLPIMLPTLIPMFGSLIALCKWVLGL